MKDNRAVIEVRKAFLCGNDHLGVNSRVCDCGCSNLLPLASILNRQPVAQQLYEHDRYEGICSSLPTIQRLMEEN
jgi:hypothetical protein